MKIIKYPISLNEAEIKLIKGIGNKHMGIKNLKGTYGATSKIIKYCITFTYHSDELAKKFIPTLPPNILDFFLLSIKESKLEEWEEQKRKNREIPNE